MMDKNIFSDPEIATLVNENFIAIKADVDSETGNESNELYNANYLPTTLFTLENGTEIDRLNGTPSREEFLNLLKKILAVDQLTPQASFASNVESSPAVTKTIVSKPVVSPPIISSANFSIQLGAFNTTENALRLIDQLNEKGVHNTNIIEEKTNGKLYQKVVLPGFYSKSEAKEKLNALKGKGLNGFVKKI